MKIGFALGCLFLSLAVSAQDAAALRQRDLQQELAYQQQRLKQVPAQLDTLRSQLMDIQKNYGISGEGVLFRVPDDLPALIENRPLHEDAFQAIVAFDRALKERGTDLIVMPVPHQVMVYGHRLDGAIQPQHNLWPAYTEGLIRLLEADVEVLDLTESFARYAGEGLVLHAADHHWSSPGMDLAAQRLSQRLSRYPHLEAYRSGQEAFVEKRKTQGVAASLFSFNKIWSSRKKKGVVGSWEEAKKMAGVSVVEDVVSWKYSGDLPHPGSEGGPGRDRNPIRKLSPDLFVLGDSMVFHQTRSSLEGAGFPNHLGRNLGFPVSFYGQSGGAAGAPLEYANRFVSLPGNPKVVVMVMRATPMSSSAGNRAWRKPKFPETDRLPNLKAEQRSRGSKASVERLS